MKLEQDIRCTLCEETIPAGTSAADLAEYTNYTDTLLVDSTDLAHRNCAIDSGDRRWSYDK